MTDTGSESEGSAVTEEPQKKGSAGRSILSFVIMVVVIIALSFFLRTFIVQAYEIPSGSMETTIMTKDMVFSEKVSYYVRQPERGDIITFIDPEDSTRTLIKRVIATGGQTVDLIDGSVYVDGVKLEESYTHGKSSYELSGSSISFPYTVPDGYVWVMGDNRTNSQDSRWFGAVPVSSITGRGWAIYWPLDHIGLLS